MRADDRADLLPLGMRGYAKTGGRAPPPGSGPYAGGMGPGALRLQRSAEESLWSMVENVVRSHGLAGLAVGVVRNGEVALSRGFGVRDVGTLEPVTSDTIFHLGSVSKSFVATAVVGLATRRAGVQEPALLRVLRYRGALPAGPPRASGEHLVRQRTTR